MNLCMLLQYAPTLYVSSPTKKVLQFYFRSTEPHDIYGVSVLASVPVKNSQSLNCKSHTQNYSNNHNDMLQPPAFVYDHNKL